MDTTLDVSRYGAPGEAIETAIRLTRVASIDVGGVEYLVGKGDGRIYFYDVNATSNFVANAPAVLGFDPFMPFVDFIVATARRGAIAQARARGAASAASVARAHGSSSVGAGA